MVLSYFVTIFLVLQLGQAITVDNCPTSVPRDQYLQTFNDVCYQFSITTWKSFSDSVRYCTSRGGTLVMIKNVEVNAFLWHQLRQYQTTKEVWLGLSDANSEGNHVWMDGSVAEYTNWALTEGGSHTIFGGDQDCATMDPKIGGQWRDHECRAGFLFGSDTIRPFICQYDPVVNPITDVATDTTSTPNLTTPDDTSNTPLSSTATSQSPSSQSTPGTTSSSSTTAISGSTETSTRVSSTSSSSVSQSSTNPSTSTLPTTSTTTAPSTTTTTTTVLPSTATTASSSTPISTTDTTVQVTSSIVKSSNGTTCPPFNCALDCGLIGYKNDANMCSICECDN